MRKNGWVTPELEAAKETGKALVRQFEDVGLSFEEAIEVWLLIFPWLVSRWEQVNEKPWPDNKYLKERLGQTLKRRLISTTRASQMRLRPLAEKIAMARLVVSLQDLVLRAASMPEVEVMQYIYISELFHDTTLKQFAGCKVGITGCPYFRNFQNDYSYTTVSVRKRYALLLQLIESEMVAKEIENTVLARCAAAADGPFIRKECFRITTDQAKSIVMAAVHEVDLPCIMAQERWNPLFPIDNREQVIVQ